VVAVSSDTNLYSQSAFNIFTQIAFKKDLAQDPKENLLNIKNSATLL